MIKWFSDINEKDFNLVGGKGFNLSKMFNYGIKVPNGFVVTSIAYDSYVKENRLKQKIDTILNDKNSTAGKAQKIKSLFTIEDFPQNLKEQIFSEMNKITSGRVAVRSSSTVEDLPGMSFAGQYSSYLNVTAADVIEKVVLCWKSLWNERAIDYRAKYNVTNEFSHGVVIQEMINSRLAGVIFTANPINGIRNEIFINASYGLGEAIVSGEVNPDQYTVSKKNGKVLKNEITTKEILCKYSNNGIEYVPVDEASKEISSLKENHIKAIVNASIKVEDYYGKPQDIEFAFNEMDEMFIVQSRDITTLFPIDNFEQDGKLRAHLSAGTVLLGMKEPFTPLGFDMFSQMFPTIINVMTHKKKPLDNSFVKYAGGRLYIDITYLLASKFVSKQFASAFSGNDLPLKDVMNKVIDKHGKKFRNQGIKFKFPWGALKYGFSMIGSMMEIRKIPNEERYDAIIQIGEEVYQKWTKISENLKTLEEKIDFIDKCMAEAFILSQKQGLYCTEMNDIVKIEKIVKKMYGDRFNMELLIHSLPRCITQELSIKMNLAAKYFNENNLTPKGDHPKVKDILDKFGHRSNIELDFGTQRWAENPEFIINQIKSYMVDRMYERNLDDIIEKKRRAEALIEEIYRVVKRDKGKRKAEKLKKRMIDYRMAAGMREYPKFDIVRIMGIARKVMLELGEELAKEGLINNKEDIFFLFKEEILRKENLKDRVEKNKNFYQKEMTRTSIPRIVLNTGETHYSAQKINPNSKVIQGMPLSPGIYEGTIRVVFDPINNDLQEGEIMVTESTNPAWTPLFATAKGLIMEYGGPVSHGGIVAREYGIPAVVGIPSASSRLKDGQRVRINGETGVVEIL
ncbi:PEP/pyruvate-binding domain-containing protein [Sporosalibacterium faouarense]|uniref:PEP/pyruvate-binding domain-containing protein n=1 Tax=Sporosalibacterium faouarense TaxID=516123 RepID=UPI00192B2F89|nr:PEP/pyruvate-binding domain-containing protein [Sporosalibacterium faouarense]